MCSFSHLLINLIQILLLFSNTNHIACKSLCLQIAVRDIKYMAVHGIEWRATFKIMTWKSGLNTSIYERTLSLIREKEIRVNNWNFLLLFWNRYLSNLQSAAFCEFWNTQMQSPRVIFLLLQTCLQTAKCWRITCTTAWDCFWLWCDVMLCCVFQGH